MSEKNQNRTGVAILAVFLSWLVPGAGHIYLGRVRRGVIILVTVGALFWGGVLVGGELTVDPRNERWWYYGQMCTGVHGLVGRYRQERLYARVFQSVGTTDIFLMDAELARRGRALVSPQDTIARAYSGVAGMLNLMAIFDALMLGMMGVRGERRPVARRRSELQPDGPAPARRGGETA